MIHSEGYDTSEQKTDEQLANKPTILYESARAWNSTLQLWHKIRVFKDGREFSLACTC